MSQRKLKDMPNIIASYLVLALAVFINGVNFLCSFIAIFYGYSPAVEVILFDLVFVAGLYGLYCFNGQRIVGKTNDLELMAHALRAKKGLMFLMTGFVMVTAFLFINILGHVSNESFAGIAYFFAVLIVGLILRGAVYVIKAATRIKGQADKKKSDNF